MGASGWKYFVPFDANFEAALTRLHQDVFQSGDYFAPGKKKPRTIDELRKRTAEDGTHSILDITRIAPRPAAKGAGQPSQPPSADAHGRIDMTRFDTVAHQRWLQERFGRFGSASELHPDELVELFGTTTPTRAQVEERLDEIVDLRERWIGTIVVIHDHGSPSELLFAGFSGD